MIRGVRFYIFTEINKEHAQVRLCEGKKKTLKKKSNYLLSSEAKVPWISKKYIKKQQHLHAEEKSFL